MRRREVGKKNGGRQGGKRQSRQIGGLNLAPSQSSKSTLRSPSYGPPSRGSSGENDQVRSEGKADGFVRNNHVSMGAQGESLIELREERGTKKSTFCKRPNTASAVLSLHSLFKSYNPETKQGVLADGRKAKPV